MAELVERLRTVLAGRYRVERELGRGGTAVVYLAIDLKHDRAVALKVLRPEIALAVGVERFLREIRIAAPLTHPHILPLHDSGEAAGSVYYVMPYVAGETLAERLAREVQLPVEDACRIARDVASALAHAHARGILHRDIKPANILLEDGEAVVSDFGVARAITVAAADRISEPGLVVGTPAYMSPEQGAAGSALDPRSDLYSLGCVLYEMLVGEPPFHGPTAQVILARHASEPPSSPRALRPTIPVAVTELVLQLLAKSPADRPRSAQEVARALEVGLSGERPAHRKPGDSSPRSRRRWWWPWGLALVAAVGAVGVTASLRGLREWDGRRAGTAESERLDPALYVVAPFTHRDSAVPALLSGDACESLLYQALAGWSGLRVVDPLRVADGRAQARSVEHGDDGHAVAGGLADRLGVARRLGAGRLVTGEVSLHLDTIRVRAAVYDVSRSGATLRESRVSIARDLHDAAARFDELARGLVADAASPGDAAGAAAAGTRSLAAWRAFDDGAHAFQRWDLPRARAAFADAAAQDSGYALPHLWLAQLMLLSGDPAAAWQEHAHEAVRLGARLAPGERARARALAALADGQYPQACDRYEALVRADSLDFLSWYGLGECHSADRLVVLDPASPSGWRFRASAQRAVDAFARALQVVPSTHLVFRGAAFDRLARLLVAEPNTYLQGYRVEGDTLWYGAWPGLGARDTLAPVPYPVAELFAGRAGTRPASHATAIARGQERLRAVTAAWQSAFPRSADALEAHGRALELLGRLPEGPVDGSALAAVRAARSATTDTAQAVRLAGAEVRLLLKLERFGAARRLADSVLAAAAKPDSAQAAMLIGLAALTGQQQRALALYSLLAPWHQAWALDGTILSPPPAVAETVLDLLVYASLGGPADSARALHTRAGRLIDSYYPRERRALAREALLAQAETHGFFDAGLRPAARPATEAEVLRQLEWDLARGDSAAVRAGLATLARRRYGRPGDVPISSAYIESRLALALGDTAGAVAWIDPPLAALPTLDQYLLELPDAAVLVRTMALRAELAAAARDTAAARAWSAAAVALWSGADAALQPLVRRMQTLHASVSPR